MKKLYIDDVPTAYVAETEVFLTTTGIIKGYEASIDKRSVGIRWSISNIAAAYRALQELRANDKKAYFITAPVTTSFLEGDAAAELERLAGDGITGDGIVLAIREKTVLTSEKARQSIKDVRSMGYGVAVYGFSGAQSLESITAVPVDYLFLSEELTALSGDRDKPGLFNALMSLLRAMRSEIVLCGVKSDDVIRDATAAECFGVIPSEEYQGEFTFPKGGLTLEQILKGEHGTL